MHQRHLNLSAVTYLVVYALIILYVLSGCRVARHMPTTVVIRDSIVEVEKIVKVAAPPIVVPGRTITLHDTVPCPDTRWEARAASEDGKQTIKAQLKNGTITISCNMDSLTLIQDSLEARVKYLETHKSKENTVYVEVPKPYVPWWVWLIVALSVSGVVIALKR